MIKKSETGKNRHASSHKDEIECFDESSTLSYLKEKYKKREFKAAGTEDSHLEKFKKTSKALKKELNEQIQEEMDRLINKLSESSFFDYDDGEEIKNRFRLNPNADASERKEYVQAIMSLIGDKLHKENAQDLEDVTKNLLEN